MAQLDKIHDAVKNALIKDGWTITADPLKIVYEEFRLLADLGAEKSLAAERGTEKIAVEIKSFRGRSSVDDFEKALGQYRLYRRLLKFTEPERNIFLAVDSSIYEKFFTGFGVQLVLEEEEVSLIVVNIESEEVLLWINQPNTKK